MVSRPHGERRSRVRLRLDAPFCVTPANYRGVDPIRGRTQDISCAGLGGMLAGLLPTGTPVKIQLHCRDEDYMSVSGIVSRCAPQEDGVTFLLGVRFVEPSVDVRVTISDLSAQRPAGLPPSLRQMIATETTSAVG